MRLPTVLAAPDDLRTAGCPVCGSFATEVVVEAPGLPVHVGVLWRDPDAARACARGDLALVACHRCGHLHNAAFDVAELDYGQDYDNSLHASSVFRAFETDLVELLAHRGAREGRIVEIGPGDGRFLRRLCEARRAPGVGFEPGLDPSLVVEDGEVELRGEPFTAAAAGTDVALVCCRQVLEHIDEPRELLAEVHEVLARSPGASAYFEVPNSRLLLHDLSIWDLVYEHCQYFVAESLRHLFEVAGFEVLDAWTGYDHQFLCIEVVPADEPDAAPSSPRVAPALEAGLADDVRRFADRFAQKSTWWRAELERRRRAGQRTVLWGGGARAVTFANLVAGDAGIAHAVDLNPAKHGTHLAGTGHAVRPPEVLRDERPDVVVVLNPIYLGEIRAHLQSLDLDPEVLLA